MLMTECTHGFAKPSQCYTCMEEGPVEPTGQAWWRQGLPFLAQYTGNCVGCAFPFEVGDRIQRWDFGTNVRTSRTEYTHAGCTP